MKRMMLNNQGMNGMGVSSARLTREARGICALMAPVGGIRVSHVIVSNRRPRRRVIPME